ncbi:hypothetical protein Sste5346_006872 [Sporothrix stenoceras]|uniref:Mitochondrial intermembrane space cysteine motif-containing protein MIX17 n=1 Tax=Sporothrix stenoceras TaxID=5173 RepID=A0ABR3YZQ8_9PEZI
MPRQRSAARPTVSRAPPKAPTQQQQTRPASYAAHPSAPPPAAAAAPGAAAPSQGPGLFGQMASTAAGVAIGSTVGHAVSGMLFGGGSSSSEAPAAAPQAAAPQQQYGAPSSAQQENWGNNCAGATQQFTTCMDENSGNMQICGWYLEQLKACQQAAARY